MTHTSKAIALALLLLLLPPTVLILVHSQATATPGAEASIKDLTATTTENDLIVFGTLAGSFTEEMIEILHSGIPINFSFNIELYRTTKNWPQEQVAAYSFQHIMAYDTLKESYRVTLEEENNRSISFKSLPDAEKMMNDINGIKIVALDQLIPDNQYTIRVKADLFERPMPFNIHNFLPFFSSGNLRLDWHSIEFKY